jgi:hypothetical protein
MAIKTIAKSSVISYPPRLAKNPFADSTENEMTRESMARMV